MVRPLYSEENKGERTPHLLLASILTTEKKTPATQPRGGSGAAKGMVVADSMGEWEWCWWQTTWENGKRQVADNMGEWEEASGSLGFWMLGWVDFRFWVLLFGLFCWYGPGQKWTFTMVMLRIVIYG
ncbi:hypothetical protein E1A91_A04G026700v1 [Gossypium mustelinum]|uniref:Uncharacterized protein n=1 Tax=Gossypium mustelinum TaxID=34275 RepID=A0A5D2ZK45_GOSMU|nr:hypothetical protein E1A91_A04G026700v1 [Gossypium mustelinum]